MVHLPHRVGATRVEIEPMGPTPIVSDSGVKKVSTDTLPSDTILRSPIYGSSDSRPGSLGSCRL